MSRAEVEVICVGNSVGATGFTNLGRNVPSSSVGRDRSTTERLNKENGASRKRSSIDSISMRPRAFICVWQDSEAAFLFTTGFAISDQRTAANNAKERPPARRSLQIPSGGLIRLRKQRPYFCRKRDSFGYL